MSTNPQGKNKSRVAGVNGAGNCAFFVLARTNLAGLLLPPIMLLLSCVCICEAQEVPIPVKSAIRAIIGEAADQGYEGMLAVACGLRNRGTLKGVYGVNAKHIDNEPKWVWDLALKAWKESATKDIVAAADHWESDKFSIPTWAKDMVVTVKIGNHVFYKRRE